MQVFLLSAGLGVVAVIAVVVAVVSQNDPRQACAWSDYRLPHWVTPKSYDVTWRPSMQPGGPLMGTVVMAATVEQAYTKCVIMHSHGFVFNSITYTYTSPDDAAEPEETYTIEGSSVVVYEENQQIGLPLHRPLQAKSQLTMTISFSGSMSETLNGMYISQSVDEATGKRGAPVIITQFEATYARKAFPCLDEPSFKATFTVRLDGIQSGLTALSNMPVAQRNVQADGTVSYAFEESVPMSTYLVAVAVGKFDAIWSTYESPLNPAKHVNVSIWAPPGNQASLQFALDAAKKSLAKYESTFRVPFPLPEMKMLGAEEFAAGAMENWGLVTYRLTALLADLNSEASKERVAVVVAHELSHQWTGNLVTTAWWGQLFLNEGFATLLEYLGTNASHPEFGVWDEFLGNDVHRAMRLDDLANVDPLVNKGVDSSGAIESQFNDIAYAKGGSVLRMLWKFMDASPLTQNTNLGPGEPSSGSIFFDALNRYLSKYAYNVATSAEMVEQLANFTNYNGLNARAATWTTQPGVPLVVFDWAGQDNADPAVTQGQMCVSQLRIFRSPYSRQEAKGGEYGASQLYWVPLTMVVENPAGSPAQALADAARREGGFDNETYACFEHDVSTAGFVKANLNSYGYYRVAYPASVWARLKAAAEASAQGQQGSVFTAQDRAGLLDDILTIAETAADAGQDADAVSQHHGGLRNSPVAGAAAAAAAAAAVAEAAGGAALSGPQRGGTDERAAVGVSRSPTSMATALDYMQTLRVEADYSVWRSGLTHISRLATALVPEDPPSDARSQHAKAGTCRDSFLAFARYLLEPQVNRIGNSTWGGAQPVVLGQRRAVDSAVKNAALIGTAAAVGNTAVVSRAVQLWQGGLEGIDPNYLSVVASTYVRNGGQAAWDEVRTAYEGSKVAFSKSILLRSLAASQDLSVLNKTLYYAMYDEKVSKQDKDTVISGVANNPVGRKLAWQFITSPPVWRQLVEWYGSGGFGWSTLISSMGSNFVSQQWFDVVDAFFKSAQLDAGADEAAQALEVIQSNIILKKTVDEQGCPWLNSHGF